MNTHKLKNILMVGFITVTTLFSCNSPSKKAEEARVKMQVAKETLKNAQQELDQALRDSIQLFKKESGEKINNNEKVISEFKVKMEKKKKAFKYKYERELKKMEKKNVALRTKLNEYKDEGELKWELFKVEFNKEMNKLDKEINNLAENMKNQKK